MNQDQEVGIVIEEPRDSSAHPNKVITINFKTEVGDIIRTQILIVEALEEIVAEADHLIILNVLIIIRKMKNPGVKVGIFTLRC